MYIINLCGFIICSCCCHIILKVCCQDEDEDDESSVTHGSDNKDREVIATLSAQLNEADVRNESLKIQVESLTQQIKKEAGANASTDLNAQLLAARAASERDKTAAQSLQNALEARESEIKEMQAESIAKIEALNSQAAELRVRDSELTSQLERSQAQCSTLQLQLLTVNGQLESITASKTALESRLVSEKQLREAETANHAEAARNHVQAFATTQAVLAEQQEGFRRLSAQHEALLGAYGAIESKLRAVTEQAERARTGEEYSNNQLAAARAAHVEEMQSLQSALISEREAAVQTCRKLAVDFDNFSAFKLTSQTKCDELVAECTALRNALGLAESRECATAQRLADSRREHSDAFGAQKQAHDGVRFRLELNLTELKEEVSRLNDALTAARRETIEAVAQCEELRQAYLALENQSERAAAAAETQADKLGAVQKELAQLVHQHAEQGQALAASRADEQRVSVRYQQETERLQQAAQVSAERLVSMGAERIAEKKALLAQIQSLESGGAEASTKLSRDLSTMHEAYTALEARLSEAAALATSGNQALVAAEASCKEARGEAIAASAQLKILTARLQDQTQFATEASQRAAASEASCAELTRSLQASEESLIQHKTRADMKFTQHVAEWQTQREWLSAALDTQTTNGALMKQERDALSAQLQTAQAAVDQANLERDAQQARKASIKADLSQANLRLEAALQRAIQAESKVDKLTIALRQAEAAQQDAQRAVQDSEARAAQQAKELARQRELAKSKLESLAADLQSLQRERDGLQAQTEQLQQSMLREQQGREVLFQAHVALQADRTRLVAEHVEALLAVRKEHRDEKEALLAQVATLEQGGEAQVATLSRTCSELSLQVEQKGASLLQTNTELREAQRVAQEAQSQLSAVESRIAAQCSELKVSRSETHAAVTQMHDLKRRERALQDQLAELAEAKAGVEENLRSSLEQATACHQALVKADQALKDSHSARASQSAATSNSGDVELLRTQLALARENEEQQEANLKDLTKSLTKASATEQQTLAALAKKDSEYSSLLERSRDLNAKIDKLSQKNRSLAQQAAQAQALATENEIVTRSLQDTRALQVEERKRAQEQIEALFQDNQRMYDRENAWERLMEENKKLFSTGSSSGFSFGAGSALSALTAKYTALEKQLKFMHEQLVAETENHKASEIFHKGKRESMQEEVNHLNNQIVELRHSLNEAKEKVERTKSKFLNQKEISEKLSLRATQLEVQLVNLVSERNKLMRTAQ